MMGIVGTALTAKETDAIQARIDKINAALRDLREPNPLSTAQMVETSTPPLIVRLDPTGFLRSLWEAQQQQQTSEKIRQAVATERNQILSKRVSNEPKIEALEVQLRAELFHLKSVQRKMLHAQKVTLPSESNKISVAATFEAAMPAAAVTPKIVKEPTIAPAPSTPDDHNPKSRKLR